jgi:hypothetical protein
VREPPRDDPAACIRAHVTSLLERSRIRLAEREAVGAEWFAHLSESCDELIEAGRGSQEAIEEAISRFGPASALRRLLRRLEWRRDLSWAALRIPIGVWLWVLLEVLATPLWAAVVRPGMQMGWRGWLGDLALSAATLITLVILLRLGAARLRRLPWSPVRVGGYFMATALVVSGLLLALRLFLPWLAAAPASGLVVAYRAAVVASVLSIAPVLWAAATRARPASDDRSRS